jgi:hypothetical protein
MLSLIVPLALGYLAVRAVAGGLTGAAETGRLDVLLSAPVSRTRLVAAGFLATAVELAAVLLVTGLLTGIGSILAGAGLDAGPAAAGFAAVWPPALLFAGLGAIAAGFSLRTSVVTGSVAGVLVAMYVIDLVGRLDPDLSGVRYLSVFKYYGNAIEKGSTRSPSPASPSSPASSPQSGPGSSSAATSRRELLGGRQNEAEGALDLGHRLGAHFPQVAQQPSAGDPADAAADRGARFVDSGLGSDPGPQ